MLLLLVVTGMCIVCTFTVYSLSVEYVVYELCIEGQGSFGQGRFSVVMLFVLMGIV